MSYDNELRSEINKDRLAVRTVFNWPPVLKQKGDLPGANVELAKAIELDQSIEATARPLLAEIEASGKPAN
jgi:hypothetical protein